MPDYSSKLALERMQKQLDEIAAVILADKQEDMGEEEGGGEMEDMGEECCPTCGKPK